MCRSVGWIESVSKSTRTKKVLRGFLGNLFHIMYLYLIDSRPKKTSGGVLWRFPFVSVRWIHKASWSPEAKNSYFRKLSLGLLLTTTREYDTRLTFPWVFFPKQGINERQLRFRSLFYSFFTLQCIHKSIWNIYAKKIYEGDSSMGKHYP